MTGSGCIRVLLTSRLRVYLLCVCVCVCVCVGSLLRDSGGRTVALSASLPAPPSLQDPLSTSPPTTTPDPSTPSAVTSGFTDYYYQLPVGWTSAALPDVNQTAGLTLFDQTVRYDNTASFQTFKYPTGARCDMLEHARIRGGNIGTSIHLHAAYVCGWGVAACCASV